MNCGPKGTLDCSLILRITTSNFHDQRQDNVRPRDLRCYVEHDEPKEPDVGDEEEDEASLLLRQRSEMVEYVCRVFTIMDVMLRDMADHFHMDMSRHHLPPCLH